MAWLGKPVLEELRFNTQHGIVDQSLHALGVAGVEAVRRLHPDNPRFERLGADDRLIVSEPFSDLPGVWREVPEATAVTVRRGGVLEERPFRVPTFSLQ